MSKDSSTETVSTPRARGLSGAGEGKEVQTTNRITGNRRWWVLGAVLLTMFFASLDQTVISTAMPVIIGDLKGLELYAWVFTAYMMASAVTVPIYGKLSDVYGRKPFYVFGLGIFIIGSAISGMAHSMDQLIAARALQGLGAGAMLTMPRITVGDIFNPQERGRWMGVLSIMFGAASILGPTLGGWITDHWGWRWVFYINLPVAILALGVVACTLPSVKTEERLKLDWQGSILLVASLIPLLLAFTWGGTRYPWGSLTIVGLFVVSVLLLAWFVLVERRAEEPVIAPALFRNLVFASTTLVALLVSMGMFGSIMFLPLFVQGVLGQTAQQSGQIITPMMLSFMVGGVIGGQIMTRTGRYKYLTLGATVLMVGGMSLFSRMGVGTSSAIVIRNMVVLGLGIGSLMPLLNVAVQNAFPYRLMGVVSAAQQFVRSLGGVIIVPILGTVMVNVFTSQLTERMPAQLQAALQRLPPAQRLALANPQGLINAETQAAIQSRFAAFGSQGVALYHQFIDAVRQSLATGIGELFWVSLVIAVLAFVVALFLPDMKLQQDEFYENEL
jgi:EmrB/QacA subfamily drug resistance transporter